MEKPHFSLIADVPYCVTMAFAIQLYANKISIFFLTKLDKKIWLFKWFVSQCDVILLGTLSIYLRSKSCIDLTHNNFRGKNFTLK